ncbi:MAG: hypothetical protein JXD23_13805 [Spirochaetales bacterium]|nr:hypothetical protein [Spirochaetales bacterium]
MRKRIVIACLFTAIAAGTASAEKPIPLNSRVVFPAYKPNRKLRVMIKSPGDPDKTTEAVVKGRYIGSVYKTPLYLFTE